MFDNRNKLVMAIAAGNSIILALGILAYHAPMAAFVALLFILLNIAAYRVLTATSEAVAENRSDVKELKRSVKILRLAAMAFSILSFFTTSNGMRGFVFENGFQAYAVSFGVQVILLVCSFGICQMNVNIQRAAVHSKFKKIIMYAVIFLFVGCLMISSSFSYSYIVNMVYKDVRLKDSNIMIEEFLMQNAHSLRKQNQEIGVHLRSGLKDNLIGLSAITSQQGDVDISNAEMDLQGFLGSIKIEKTQSSITSRFDDAARQDTYDLPQNRAVNNQMQPLELFQTTVSSHYKTYDQAVKRLEGYALENLSDMTVEILNIRITEANQTVIALQAIIDDPLDVSGYDKTIAGYKSSLHAAATNLQTEYNAVLSIYQELQLQFASVNKATTQKGADALNLNEIAFMIYSNEVDIEQIKQLISNLETHLQLNYHAGTQELDIETVDTLRVFLDYLNEYKKYAELEQGLTKFIENDLSRTYFIVSSHNEDYEDLVANGGIELKGSAYWVTEDVWKAERKQHFSTFINLLKTLPDSEILVTADTVLTNQFNEEIIIRNAYRINRNLLENLTDFEVAILIIQSEFKAMAYVSLFIAVFLDFASFLVGCFIFIIRYMDNDSLQDENVQEDQLGVETVELALNT